MYVEEDYCIVKMKWKMKRRNIKRNRVGKVVALESRRSQFTRRWMDLFSLLERERRRREIEEVTKVVVLVFFSLLWPQQSQSTTHEGERDGVGTSYEGHKM